MPGPRIVHLALTLALAGCTRRGEPAAVTPPDAGAPAAKLFDDARVESPIGGAAGTADAPIPRCGARDSYRYVAAEFRCPEGGNPLADRTPSFAFRAEADAIDVIGSADVVRDTFRAYVDAGVDVPVLMPLPWGGERRQVLADTMEAAASA